jgi:hypothetical protein
VRKQAPPEPETTEEYREGRKARQEGAGNDTNPHPSGSVTGGGLNNSRVRWFDGWYDEKFKTLGMQA